MEQWTICLDRWFKRHVYGMSSHITYMTLEPSVIIRIISAGAWRSITGVQWISRLTSEIVGDLTIYVWYRTCCRISFIDISFCMKNTYILLAIFNVPAWFLITATWNTWQHRSTALARRTSQRPKREKRNDDERADVVI